MSVFVELKKAIANRPKEHRIKIPKYNFDHTVQASLKEYEIWAEKIERCFAGFEQQLKDLAKTIPRDRTFVVLYANACERWFQKFTKLGVEEEGDH